MDPMVYEFLGVVARWLLTSIGGYLVAHHILNADQSERYVTAFAHDIAFGLPMIGGLLWGLWTRYHGRIKLLTALSNGPMSENEVKAIIASGQVTPTITTPPSTIPGVPV